MTLHIAAYRNRECEALIVERAVLPRSGDTLVLDDGRRLHVTGVFIGREHVGLVGALRDALPAPWEIATREGVVVS
ncbi:MAG: hypothetical protein JWM87_681 [Candidatus Eremiobacteraeota bacterium]|nr:hypothetical protein [Candidatus Eremiobacteraeota bacterium]